MPGQRGALKVDIDTKDLRQLYVDLKGVEGNLRVELRKGVKAAAEPIASAVRSAASWSSRIPGAVRVKPSFGARSTGVTITVDGGRAPEARVLEHGGRGGNFRHPVYGNREVWVSQRAQPFFFTTVSSGSAVDSAEKAILAAMDAIARKAGFR
jgi:hypothetical protein